MKKNIIKNAILTSVITATAWSASILATESVKEPPASSQTNKSKPARRKYNYAVIEEGTTKKVIVSGYNRNDPDTVASKTNLKNPAKHPITIARTFKDIPDKYKHYPAGSVIPVDLPMRTVMSIKTDESVTIDLPIGQLVATHDSISTDSSGNKTWVGHLSEEGIGYRMILSQGSAGVMGHIITPKGTFNVEGDGTSTYLIDTRSFQSAGYNGDAIAMNTSVQSTGTPAEQLQATVSTVKTTSADDKKITGASTTNNASKNELKTISNSIIKPRDATPSTIAPTNTPVVNTVVDLMVLYTTATTSADFAKQRIQYLVTASNQAYKDSGINMTLRLVYAEPTTYAETISNAKALADLSSEQGVFLGVQAKRVEYGADLVFLFRPLHTKTHGSCGTTYVQFNSGQPADSAKSFGTISDGIDKDGNTILHCGISVFPHEIGHSFGLVHDVENSPFPGAFSFSYAWGIEDKFATIMSYKSPIVMLFSTPALKTECATLPCGFDDASNPKHTDQVKSINIMSPTVAAFMPTMVKTALLK